MNHKLIRHLDIDDLLPDIQSVHRTGFSTETTVFRLLDGLHRNADRDGAKALLYLNLSTAFDIIDHGMLLNLLSMLCGSSGNGLVLLLPV